MKEKDTEVDTEQDEGDDKAEQKDPECVSGFPRMENISIY